MAKTLADYQKEEQKKKEYMTKQRAKKNVILQKAKSCKNCQCSKDELEAEYQRILAEQKKK